MANAARRDFVSQWLKTFTLPDFRFKQDVDGSTWTPEEYLGPVDLKPKYGGNVEEEPKQTELGRGRINLSHKTLIRLLMLPDDTEITNIQYDGEQGVFALYVRHPDLPICEPGCHCHTFSPQHTIDYTGERFFRWNHDSGRETQL